VVGRDDEVDLLIESVGRATGGAVVVRGAAGVGKTRLLRATVSALEQRGRTARLVVGVPSSSLPFGALAQYLPADVIESETPTLVNHAIRTLSAPPSFGRPLVVVDDAHLLDHSSALVVGQLLRSVDVDVICSWRSGETTPNLGWVIHDEGSVVVELQPLSLDDVSRLLDAVLGPPVSPATKAALYERSRGSSLFLRELIEDGRATGALTMGDVGWVLSPTWQPGARVMDLVAARIGRRTETEQVVLEALALAEPVPLDLLVSISHAEALVNLERAQVIEVRADGLRADVRFAHPLYGESVRSRLGLAAVRQRKRALADALAATGMRRRGDLLTLARWRLVGGGELEADQWATAARQAIALNAPEAEAITRRAVEAGAGTVAWVALGHLRADARDLSGAMDAFDRAAAVANDENERVLVAVGHARALSWVADQADDALAVLHEASQRVDPGDARLPLAIQRVAVLVNAGRLTEGLTEIETILALDLPPEPRIETLNVRAVALAFAGRTDEARDAADQLLAEAFAIRDSHPHLLHLLPSAASPSLVVRLVAGDLHATADLVDRFRPAARGAEANGYIAALEGRLALMQGRVRTALDLLRDAQPNLALTMTRARSIWAESLADEAAAHLGLPPEPAAGAELDPGGDLAHRFLVVDAMRARASAEAQRGNLPSARRLLEDSVRVSREGGMLAGEIWAAYEGFRIGGEGFADTLVSLAGRMQGPVGELFPRHAAARVADAPAELESTALALSEAGFNLCASGCAAEASRSYRRHGISGGATRCAALAQRLQERCEGAGRAELSGLGELAGLTPRERDVTLLAAKGLTNRQIADTTCTSSRTVEGHLLRAYKKLGVTSRAELASHFGDD
jgi:DNA-binding CsgD family transcriptional regulator/tetratricopeptide (TPR) repeat protein